MRWLIRFGYDGAGLHGWARQPDRPTVEGEILAGLRSRSIVSTASEARLEVASRTDRGVSARANVLALSSSLGGPALLRALNGISSDLWFTALAPIPEEFRVRHAVRRIHRYFESDRGVALEPTRAAAALFRGEIDVRSFGRNISRGAPVLRVVEAVELRTGPEGWLIEVRGPSFVWGMVRKIVGALREVGAGRISLEVLEKTLRGERRLTLPIAEAEPLVLWDVQFDVPWTVHWRGPNRNQGARLRSGHAALRARSSLFHEIRGK